MTETQSPKASRNTGWQEMRAKFRKAFQQWLPEASTSHKPGGPGPSLAWFMSAVAPPYRKAPWLRPCTLSDDSL